MVSTTYHYVPSSSPLQVVAIRCGHSEYRLCSPEDENIRLSTAYIRCHYLSSQYAEMFPVWVCCEHRGRRRRGDKEVRASDRAALSPEDLNSIACRQLLGINARSQLVQQLLQPLPQGISATAGSWHDLAFQYRGSCVGALMFGIRCYAICCMLHNVHTVLDPMALLHT